MEQRREPVPVAVGSISSAWRPEIVEFVRQAYRRRPAGWPKLYDELTRMASRGTFRGLGFAELAELGLSFSLCELPKLAMLVTEIGAEEAAAGAVLLAADGSMGDAAPLLDDVEEAPAVVRFQPRILQRVPEPDRAPGPRLTVVRGAAG